MNMELTCTRCRDILPEYAAGALSAAESGAVENHLAHCAACRQELTQWRAMVEMMRQAEALVPNGRPAAIWSAIQAQISSESPVVTGERLVDFDQHQPDMEFVFPNTTPPSQNDRRPRRRTTVMAAVAAVLLVMLGATVFALRPQHQSGGATPPTQTPTAHLPTGAPAPLLPALGEPNTVAILSANDIWAIGNIANPPTALSSQLVHFDGNQWRASSATTYPGDDLRAISMDSADDGWAVGLSGSNNDNDPNAKPLFLHYTGGRWVTATISNTTFRPGQVQMLSATDGWAFGLEGNAQAALHYNNGMWQEVTITLPTNAPMLSMQPYSARSAPPTTPSATPPTTPQFYQVQMFSDTDGWAIGTAQNKYFVWRLHNGQWSASYTTSTGLSFAFGANSPDDAWLTSSASNTAAIASSGTGYSTLRPASSGLSALHHFNGNAWVAVQWPGDFGSRPWGLFRDGARWLSGPAMDSSGNYKTTLLHNQNGNWSATSLPTGVFDVVSVIDQPDGSALALALNNYGVLSFTEKSLLRFANGTWNVVH